MSEPITYVGIDAHKVDLQVALLVPDATEPVIWTVANEARAVDRLRRKLERTAPGPIACCYEAGPCGYALQRQLDRGRVRCEVIAPALVPRKPGERIKTDRRDARKLAELHRAGLLTVVRAPTPAEEAVRDLCRARDDARVDRQRCRHRLGKLLLRRGLDHPGRAWTGAGMLRPEFDWEGADAPLEPSVRSTAYGQVNQLRDPAIYEENGRRHLPPLCSRRRERHRRRRSPPGPIVTPAKRPASVMVALARQD